MMSCLNGESSYMPIKQQYEVRALRRYGDSQWLITN